MSRPKIPQAMARNIRKRCGYGCIVCGLPLYEYHHINGFKPNLGHIESEITLLCDSCHRKEQNGIISRDEVLKHDADPINWKNGKSKPERVWYSDDIVNVVLGTNKITIPPIDNTMWIPLLIEGKAIIRLKVENNAWLLSLSIVDPWHRPVITIADNHLEYAVGDLDITFSAGRLLCKMPEHVYFEAVFTPPNLEILNGIFFWNGIAVTANKNGLRLVNKNIICSDLHGMYWPVGFSYGRDIKTRKSMIHSSVEKRLLPDADGFREIDETDIDVDENDVD